MADKREKTTTDELAGIAVSRCQNGWTIDALYAKEAVRRWVVESSDDAPRRIGSIVESVIAGRERRVGEEE